MNNYTKTVGVGILFLLGIAVFLGGALWLRGKSLGSRDLAILFKDIGNLKEGAPVRISGAPMGRVETIVYQAPGPGGGGRQVRKTTSCPRRRHRRHHRRRHARRRGDHLDPGTGPPLAPGETIKGTIATGVFDKAGVLVDQATKTLTMVNAMLDPKLIADLRRTLATTEKLERYLSDTEERAHRRR